MSNPIHLYFGVRSEQDIYDEERLHALAARFPNLKVNVVVATGPFGAPLSTRAVHLPIWSPRV